MSEKPIRQNTIVSTTDKRLTLLQWLKSLDKNVTELQENGVDMNLLVFNSVQEFYEYFKANYLGKTCELPYLLRYTATPDEASDSDVDYYIYVYGTTDFDIEGESISIYVKGPVFQYDYNSDACDFCIGAFINLYKQTSGLYGLENIEPITGWYPSYAIDYQEMNTAISNAITKFSTDEEGPLHGLFKDLLGKSKTLSATAKTSSYGIFNVFNNSANFILGNVWKDGSDGLSNYRHFYGFAIVDNEIYYSTGQGRANLQTGEIENAISGTELKEAVQRAIQKTYWHTIKLHDESLSNVHITIVIPSHSNTPVVDQQGFISIGAGDTWGCSGTMALSNDSLEFVTFDNVKFGTNFDNTIFSGTLGRTFTLNQLLVKGISFTDNVKEVK